MLDDWNAHVLPNNTYHFEPSDAICCANWMILRFRIRFCVRREVLMLYIKFKLVKKR